MNIQITKGSGTGPTELSAFDSALMSAGIGDQNLICLSSVIPPGSNIVYEKPSFTPKDFGSKLYVVISEVRSSTAGQEMWVGIGWVQEASTKKGLFVEHHSNTQKGLEDMISNSLNHMTASRPNDNWSEIQMSIEGTTCNGQPTSVLVSAVYQIEGW